MSQKLTSEKHNKLFDKEHRFYGRRQGRKLTPARARLIDDSLPKIMPTLPEAQKKLDPRSLFPSSIKEIWLEIGFGNGEHLIAQAKANPDIGIIGCEPFMNGVSTCLAEIETHKIENIRIWPDDARLLLDALHPNGLNRVFILHPDPWPKKRHKKRRLVQTELLNTLSSLMKPNAELRMASDAPNLVEWMLEKAFHHPNLEWMAKSADDWRKRPSDWPQTKYERKGLKSGRPPVYMIYKNIKNACKA